MAAPKGNTYYQLAQKSLGRKRTYATAKEFTKDFLAYIKWAEDNPIMTKKASKRSGTGSYEGSEKKHNTEEVRTEAESKRRPFSMYGLCVFLGVSRKYFESSLRNLENKQNRTEEEEDLFTVQMRARDLIMSQQLEGACVGDFNPLIVTRLLGLKDGADITTNGESIQAPIAINILRDERCGRREDE